MVSRLFLDLGPVLGQLCALLDGQAEQVDEAGSIGLVIVLIHAEGAVCSSYRVYGEVTPALIMLPL